MSKQNFINTKNPVKGKAGAVFSKEDLFQRFFQSWCVSWKQMCILQQRFRVMCSSEKKGQASTMYIYHHVEP